MKTTIIFRFVLAFCLLACIYCSKDVDNEEVTFRGTMEAKINGELIIFDWASGDAYFDLDNSCYKPFHAIQGVRGFEAFSPSDYDKAPPDGQSIHFRFDPFFGLGTYNSGASTVMMYDNWDGHSNKNIKSYSQWYFDSETQTEYIEEGFVTIISIENGRIKGTFYFTAVNTMNREEKIFITDGKFEINERFPESCN